AGGPLRGAPLPRLSRLAGQDPRAGQRRGEAEKDPQHAPRAGQNAEVIPVRQRLHGATTGRSHAPATPLRVGWPGSHFYLKRDGVAVSEVKRYGKPFAPGQALGE